MAEYSSNNSTYPKDWMKYKYFEDRVEAMKVISEDRLSRSTRISVEGYSSYLDADDITKALLRKFESCGQIYDVVIPRDPVSQVVERCGFIYFMEAEEGAQEKALALNGSDVGGWNVIVKALPKKVCKFSPDHVAAAHKLIHTRRSAFVVTGYDTSRPPEELRSALLKHFSSCGEIAYVSIKEDLGGACLPDSFAYVSIAGEGALEKALALSGSDVGGCKIDVFTPKRNTDPNITPQ